VRSPGAAAHYIIFHPEKKRIAMRVHASEVVGGCATAWEGRIWVDRPPGNGDPFVFNDPWLYSYCHATQLRRTPGGRQHVQEGSTLLFCSGEEADKGSLVIDTVFVVGRAEAWPRRQLPARYHQHRKAGSAAWRLHLSFGASGSHPGVFTYEARPWSPREKQYSYFPLTEGGERAAVRIDNLPRELKGSVTEKCKRKRPVLLGDENLEVIFSEMNARATRRIIGTPNPFRSAIASGDKSSDVCDPRR
jgi:hypothetical protein